MVRKAGSISATGVTITEMVDWPAGTSFDRLDIGNRSHRTHSFFANNFKELQGAIWKNYFSKKLRRMFHLGLCDFPSTVTLVTILVQPISHEPIRQGIKVL